MKVLLSFLSLILLASGYADVAFGRPVDSACGDFIAEADSSEAGYCYSIDVTAAFPSGHGQVILTSPYSLKISREKVESSLPYFGRAYNIPYGGGNGLFFSAAPEEYSDMETGSGQRKITFKVRTDEDLFRFTVTIDCPDKNPQDGTGAAFITVSSGQRQTISYRGRLVR